MTAIAMHTSLMTGRQLRALARQPAYLVISLIQPVIWLFLFGQLFRRVIDIPGFAYHGNVNGCAEDLGYGRWEPCNSGR